MMQYPIVMYPSEEGSYVAIIPVLKGCFAQGETLDVIHPGRTWAERCNVIPKAESIILANIDRHFQNIGGQL